MVLWFNAESFYRASSECQLPRQHSSQVFFKESRKAQVYDVHIIPNGYEFRYITPNAPDTLASAFDLHEAQKSFPPVKNS